jgi:hypothetical protein
VTICERHYSRDQYVRSKFYARGAVEIMRTLEQLVKKYDERFRLDQGWSELK